MRELGSVPLRSSYDRIFLYRCVTQHVSPKPENFAQKDLMTTEVRLQIAERLKEFFVRFVHGRQEKKGACMARWSFTTDLEPNSLPGVTRRRCRRGNGWRIA